LRDDVGAHHAHAARVGAREPGDEVDERGLAGAVRAEQPEELAALDRQADAVERAQAAIALLDLPDFYCVQWVGSRLCTP